MFAALSARLRSLAERGCALLSPVPPLLARLAFGQMFVLTGLGKLRDLPQIVKFFDSLGIPFAKVQAPIIAWLELVGGIALMLGLLTRLFAFLLACTMVTALVLADGGQLLASLPLRDDVTRVAPLAPLLTFLWLMVHGGGPIGLDSMFVRLIAPLFTRLFGRLGRLFGGLFGRVGRLFTRRARPATAPQPAGATPRRAGMPAAPAPAGSAARP